MAIPLATTTISVLRQSEEDLLGEPEFSGDDTSSYNAVASGIRANIGSPGATVNTTSGQQVSTGFKFQCDPVIDLDRTDLIKDEKTGIVYTLNWAQLRTGLGINHWEGALFIVEGLA